MAAAARPAAAARGRAAAARAPRARTAPRRAAARAAAPLDGVAAPLGGDDVSLALQIGLYAAKTLVDWLVPLGGFGLLAFAAASQSGSRARRGAALARAAELDDEELGRAPGGRGGGGLGGLGLGGKKAARGAPTEYLKVEKLNARLDSYSYSLQKATAGGGAALSAARRRALERRVGPALVQSLDTEALAALDAADAQWARAGAAANAELDRVARAMRAEAVAKAAKKKADGKGDGASDGEAGDGEGGFKMPSFGASPLEKEMEKALKARASAEARYVSAVAAALDGEQRERLTALLASESAPGFAAPSLLPRREAHAAGADAAAAGPKRVFVLTFKGDIQASQVNALREEVTAVIRGADGERGDECVVVLSSGGGTVTGYGLAAAQLARIKAAGIKLTINVEQVAASGGYMMACVGDTINASPFAVLGSIGVISEQPNVYKRLKDEGIEFTTVTAGKYKRTLTPTKKVTEEDLAKSKEDVADILKLFRGFVGKNRPQLDLDEVATGETWFGEDALEKGLCDALKTADDYLLELLDAGADIFSVRYAPPPTPPALPGLAASATEALGAAAGAGGLRAALGSWLLGGAALPPPPAGGGYYVADPLAGSERITAEGVGSAAPEDNWPDWR